MDMLPKLMSGEVWNEKVGAELVLESRHWKDNWGKIVAQMQKTERSFPGVVIASSELAIERKNNTTDLLTELPIDLQLSTLKSGG